jgi:myb proto-oncogene protein
MEARTGKQCRERYINHLSPRVKTDPWTPEEDDKIIKLHSMIGTKWCKFIPHLPGLMMIVLIV